MTGFTTELTTPPAPALVLGPQQWQARQAAHEAAVDELVEPHRQRVRQHQQHPVYDFLFSYYTLRPAALRQWHPGASVGLLDAPTFSTRRFYRTDGRVTSVDLAGFIDERRATVSLVRALLPATSRAPAQFGCFGLHEWAMVHQQGPSTRRHPGFGLRLSEAETNDVVQSHQIRCSHFDAYRFFTPTARPLNLLRPSVESRVGMEQGGCLHANMDLYKWAYKMLPVVSAELLLSTFRLARDIREFDMRASPYDLAELGYPPVRIETAAGKAEYVAAQRVFADRSEVLRQRLIIECAEPALTASKCPAGPPGSAPARAHRAS